MSKELILLIGPPGSGKTTYCTKFLVPASYMVISQDYNGGDKVKTYNEFISLLSEKYERIVIDRMNFNKQQRERWITPAKQLGYKIIGIQFSCRNEIAKMRAKARTNHPTLKAEKVDEVFEMYEKSFISPVNWNKDHHISDEIDEFYCINEFEIKKS